MASAAATATADIVVDPEFDNTIPPLAAEELALLEESLVREGCREPLLVMAGTNILLDGHNRHAICTRLGIPFEVKAIDVATRDAALLWIIENQLGRRNLSVIDRIALVVKREPLLRARAAARQATRSQLPQNSAEADKAMVTREAAAAAAGVSHDTYTKGKRILERALPEVVQAVRDDTVSIHAAAQLADLTEGQQREAISGGSIKEAAKSLTDRSARSTDDIEHTPDRLLKAARTVMGTIDTDPATSEYAQLHVRAITHFTKDHDGLAQPWSGNVWLAPPCDKDLSSLFVAKLVNEYTAGNVKAAILLVGNQTESESFQLAASKATRICFPLGPIRFVRANRNGDGSAPRPQAAFYFGPDGDRFVEVFGQLGVVMTPVPLAKSADTTAPKGDTQ